MQLAEDVTHVGDVVENPEAGHQIERALPEWQIAAGARFFPAYARAGDTRGLEGLRGVEQGDFLEASNQGLQLLTMGTAERQDGAQHAFWQMAEAMPGVERVVGVLASPVVPHVGVGVLFVLEPGSNRLRVEIVAVEVPAGAEALFDSEGGHLRSG